MQWDHTVGTWTARCTMTSPGGHSATTLRLSPLTTYLYILASWHAGPTSWSGISLSGACGNSDLCFWSFLTKEAFRACSTSLSEVLSVRRNSCASKVLCNSSILMVSRSLECSMDTTI